MIVHTRTTGAQLDRMGLVHVPELEAKITELYETLLVRHGVMVVGPVGTGKSTCFDVLAAAMGLIGQTVDTVRINPKAVTMEELYGSVDLATLDWHDGILSGVVRRLKFETEGGGGSDGSGKSGGRRPAAHNWILFDGPVDSLWIESMNTVLDDNKLLCLPNNERIKLPPRLTMVFEAADLDQASPATVSRCGMIYVNSGTVPASALLDAWIHDFGVAAATAGDEPLAALQPTLESLLRGVALPLLAFVRRRCGEVVETCDVGLVHSLLHMADAQLRVFRKPLRRGDTHGDNSGDGDGDSSSGWESETETLLDAQRGGGGGGGGSGGDDDDDHVLGAAREAYDDDERIDLSHEERIEVLEKALVFAMTWSLGGALLESWREPFDTTLRDLLRDAGAAKAAPSSGLVYDSVFDPLVGKWQAWMSLVRAASVVGLESGRDGGAADRLVPTAETVQVTTITEMLVRGGHHVLTCGPSGSGKTSAMRSFLSRDLKAPFEPTFVGFSATTTAATTRAVLESKLDRRRGGVLGPSGGGRLVIFVDDLNMPTPERYGAQPPIELLRQAIGDGGWYETRGNSFVGLEDIQFTAAMKPIGGDRFVTPRLLRHFSVLHCPDYARDSLEHIFTAILKGGRSAPAVTGALGAVSGAAGGLSEEIRARAVTTVQATLELYETVASTKRPTPSRPHYIFNIQFLFKVSV